MSEFDLRTHVRSAKGDITSKQPYRMKVVDGRQLFERPPGCGTWVAQNGEVVIKGEPQAEPEAKKPQFTVAELEQMLAQLQPKAEPIVESAPVVLTQPKAPAHTKDVKLNK